MAGISYKLEKFEGPLDLLLHLIEKNKIDIYDIPIVEITHQYLAYVNQMEEEDLNIVSDFLHILPTFSSTCPSHFQVGKFRNVFLSLQSEQ